MNILMCIFVIYVENYGDGGSSRASIDTLTRVIESWQEEYKRKKLQRTLLLWKIDY